MLPANFLSGGGNQINSQKQKTDVMKKKRKESAHTISSGRIGGQLQKA